MTESDWLTSNDPRAMLNFAHGNDANTAEGIGGGGYILSDRKLRLFACACLDLRAQQKSGLFSRVSEEKWQEAEIGDIIQSAAEWAESWAEGPSTDWPSPADKAALLREVFGNPFRPVTRETLFSMASGRGLAGLHGLSTVISVAQTIYSERRFEDMPILADALTEAGCTERVTCHGCNGDGGFQANSTWVPCELCAETVDESTWTQIGTLENPIIAHLRSPGPHCLGCWVLDTILGKE